MIDHPRAPRPSLDLATIFVASHNPRYRSAVAWARQADVANVATWRMDDKRDGIWVGRGWITDQITYGPFDRLRELPYDSGTRVFEPNAIATRPASAGHRFQQARRWDDV